MKIDPLKLITGNLEGSVLQQIWRRIRFQGRYLPVRINFPGVWRCEKLWAAADCCDQWCFFPNALGEISSALLAPRMMSGRSRFSLALATTACVDGSFEANSPRIRSHLAQATSATCVWRTAACFSHTTSIHF